MCLWSHTRFYTLKKWKSSRKADETLSYTHPYLYPRSTYSFSTFSPHINLFFFIAQLVFPSNYSLQSFPNNSPMWAYWVVNLCVIANPCFITSNQVDRVNGTKGFKSAWLAPAHFWSTVIACFALSIFFHLSSNPWIASKNYSSHLDWKIINPKIGRWNSISLFA